MTTQPKPRFLYVSVAYQYAHSMKLVLVGIDIIL